ncbi:hypothetical protein, partial [Globicatella sanguinis]
FCVKIFHEGPPVCDCFVVITILQKRGLFFQGDSEVTQDILRYAFTYQSITFLYKKTFLLILLVKEIVTINIFQMKTEPFVYKILPFHAMMKLTDKINWLTANH